MASKMPLSLFGLVALASGNPVLAQPAEKSAGSGEDILLPLSRVDLRAEASGEGDSNEYRLTLRLDHAVELREGWRVNLRADAPYVFANEVEEDGHEHRSSGFGDLLLHLMVVRELAPEEGLGFGVQLIAPTAGSEALGTGKWRLRPTVGYRWPAPGISEASFFQLIARHDVSVAGDEERRKISQLQIAPNLEISLKGDTYVSFFPSTDIRYDFTRDEFFVPVNVEVGKEWGKLVASLEGAAGVIKGDHPPYDWKFEARIGYRF